ncbi:MAG: hypothetical protein OXF08_07695 [Bacteroidetes bacterium]|nr:hypothetical protein [Bacteroidota bacterium]
MIRDWLTKAGGAVGDTSAWIDAIVLRSNGWLQHIIAYAIPAKEYLESHQGQMTGGGLEFILEQGDQERDSYYNARMTDITLHQRQVLARIFSDLPPDSPIEKEYLINALAKDHSSEVAAEMFKDLLHRGVVASRGDETYGIPIPSFRTWLLDNYERGRGKDGESDFQ